jgi:cytoskeletal protein CcmA (bactofilin family)
MWKKEDAKPQGVTEISTAGAVSGASSATSSNVSSSPLNSGAARETIASLPLSSRAPACISQGIKIKGEVTGSEDLFVDGQVDGKLSLTNGSLTVGPNGTVKADVTAREVIVRGKVEGKVSGRDKVQLWSTGQVTGEIQTDRLAIEDGALLRGRVEAGKHPARANESSSSAVTSSAPPSGKSSSPVPLSSGGSAD